MATTASIDSDRAHTHPIVELRVRADPGQLPVLRAVAAAIALQHDFDLDTVADVKLALDEAATRLIMSAVDGTDVTCRFQAIAPALRISVSAGTRPSSTTSARTFGWHVLNSLADSVDVRVDDTPAGSVTTIDLSVTEGSAAR
ncbi:ATP-binding protein [Rhodococcus phenolicus]|uniref:ATP-binding protein n=1 Tax=Rhodococcus phenolicus TaxID=263849 RepID=UPI00083314B4|nr:ATP-binding protein [Rhodococcus phenolicus]